MRPSDWIPSTAVWSGWHLDRIFLADSRMAQGVPVHQGDPGGCCCGQRWQPGPGVQEDGEEGGTQGTGRGAARTRQWTGRGGGWREAC